MCIVDHRAHPERLAGLAGLAAPSRGSRGSVRRAVLREKRVRRRRSVGAGVPSDAAWSERQGCMQMGYWRSMGPTNERSAASRAIHLEPPAVGALIARQTA